MSAWPWIPGTEPDCRGCEGHSVHAGTCGHEGCLCQVLELEDRRLIEHYAGMSPTFAGTRALTIDELTAICSTCNHGGHVCPGCGIGLEHGRSCCKECEKL